MILLRAAEMAEEVNNGYCRITEEATIEKFKKMGSIITYPTAEAVQQFKDLGQKPYLKIVEKKIGKNGKEWIDKIFSAVAQAEAEMEKNYKSLIGK